jgi:LAO/AO transport system kinase
MKPDAYVAGIQAGDRSALARAITLMESLTGEHQARAQEILQQLLPRTGGGRRVGITGVPGVGKSTFIEALGCHLIKQGHKVAVLAIDPSSSRTGGSILGDKTRMEQLSREPKAFIRPSPAGDHGGGVARHTRETMLLCEAAGFDIVLVESMGVGQGEIALRSMVDFYLLLQLPGAGDELQGIKRGIVELADMILINKADGDNRMRAEQARAEQETALHYAAPATTGWQTEVRLCSAQTGDGIAAAWERIVFFYEQLGPKGVIAARRKVQMLDWLSDAVREELRRKFYDDPAVRARLPEAQAAVVRGEVTVRQAAQGLLQEFFPTAGSNAIYDK